MKKRIRTGIIGYGNSGKLAHANAGMLKNPEFEIIAISDLSEKNRLEGARDHQCHCYADHREMLKKESLDLVSIITRSDTHCEITCDCLKSGVNTVITKPWALNTREADIIMETWRAGGAQLFPWLPIHWSPDFRKIRELLKAGVIGEVFAIRRHICGFSRREDWQTELRFGGGYLLNWGAHIVQPLLALANSPVKQVFGKLGQIINPGDGEDNFLAILEFENGILGTAEFTQAVEGLPWFMIQGTLGMIRSDEDNIVLTQVDPGNPSEKSETVFPIKGKMFGDEADIYRDISRSLLRQEPFPVSPDDAYYETRVLDWIRESHHSQQVIHAPLQDAPSR